jgi:LPXTG-motif cell wall-anchored protein
MYTLARAAIAGSISTLIVVGGALPALAAPTTLDPPKEWVCKYVGTPGVDERLQTGNNPILRDRKAGDVIGTWFVDAQGRSVVIAWGNPGDNAANSPNKKTVADCRTRPTTTTTTTSKRPTTTSTRTTTTATQKPSPRGVPGKTGVEDEVPVLPFAGLGALAVAGTSFVALKRRQH